MISAAEFSQDKLAIDFLQFPRDTALQSGWFIQIGSGRAVRFFYDFLRDIQISASTDIL